MFWLRASARASGHTAVVLACTESIKSVKMRAVSEQLSSGRLMKPLGVQLRSVAYPNEYSARTSFNAVAVAGHEAPDSATSTTVFGPLLVHRSAATRAGFESHRAIP
jgi:hypothetical protein